ncbi:uncharacterized protein LOC143845794 [Tasmannia lanceolata]|uniref:uncharacterized protein LOC143845794 n=1 Tax=Tasmannia lanceolata TaxID=3420 RepID=UPI0040642AED
MQPNKTYHRRGNASSANDQNEEGQGQDPLVMIAELLRGQAQTQAANQVALAQAQEANQAALQNIAASLAGRQEMRAVAGQELRAVVDSSLLHRQFRDYHPPEFSGAGDPLAADHWIVEVERIFAVMDCSNAQRIRLATFLLKADAGVWWGSVEQSYPAAKDESWAQFKVRFNNQYFPAHVKNALASKFASLSQGVLTVAQYGAKFRQLSRYAHGYAATEEDKVRKFIDGLRPSIMANIINLRPQTLVEACEMAEVAERSEKLVQATRVQFSANRSQMPPPKKQRTDSGTPSRAVCPICEKAHSGQCWRTMNVCFNCGDPSHKQRNCPRIKRQEFRTTGRDQKFVPPYVNQNGKTMGNLQQQQNQPRPPLAQQQILWRENQNRTQNQGRNAPQTPVNRVFALSQQDAEASDAVIEGQLFINHVPAHILIDSGSTLSFISPVFAQELNLIPVPLLNSLRVVTPIGDVVVTDLVCKGCVIKIRDRELLGDLVLLDMNDFKVILGMDWLASYHASVDCFHKLVKFSIPGEEEFVFEGVKCPKKIRIIAALKAQKLISKGCECYLAYVKKEDDKLELSAAHIPVVREFLDVFPEDLTDLPPHREVDFTIDLELGTKPISKAPYRMAPAELKELKEQLSELLEKGFIRPSSSPWGAPVLFVKKKDAARSLLLFQD